MFFISGPEFSRAVESVAPAVDTRVDYGNPALAGIHLAVLSSRDILRVTAGDGYRFSTVDLSLAFSDPDSSPAYIPDSAVFDAGMLRRAAKELRRADNILVTPAPDFWTFSSDGTSFAVPIIEGRWPDFSLFTRPSHPDNILAWLNPKYLTDALKNAPPDATVTISRHSNSPQEAVWLTVSSRNDFNVIYSRHCIMPYVGYAEHRTPPL